LTQPEYIRPTLTMADYVAIVRRRAWVIAETTVLLVAVSLLFSVQQEKLYQASAQMLISRQDLGAALTGLPNPDASVDPVRLAQTQAQLARVPEVARRTVDAARIPGLTPSEFLASSDVSASDSADLLTFAVRNSAPGAAQKLATTYANVFSTYQLELSTRTLKQAQRDLEARAAQLASAGGKGTAQYQNLIEKAQQLRTVAILQQRNTVVKDAGQATQIKPTPKKNVLLGAIVGFVLGIGIIFAWEALDKRVRSEAEIEGWLGLPLLARLPAPPRRLSKERRLTMLDDPANVHAETVRRLRTNVEFANLTVDAKTLMVTSSMQDEGKSTTIANLAVAFARAGSDVVLVDLDLRHPMIGDFFRVPGERGVGDIVRWDTSLDAVLVEIPLPNRQSADTRHQGPREDHGRLNLLLAGSLPENPGEFVGSPELDEILTELRARFDYVFIDAPPMLAVGDGMTISTKVDAVIVVARIGKVDRRALRDLARELDVTPAAKLGYVVTGVDLDEAYGSSDYRYYAGGNPTPAPPSQSARRDATARR
jgi:capsular exopolysaccharide synthesis family protein